MGCSLQSHLCSFGGVRLDPYGRNWRLAGCWCINLGGGQRTSKACELERARQDAIRRRVVLAVENALPASGDSQRNRAEGRRSSLQTE